MCVRLVFRRPVCYGYTAIFSVLLSIQTSFMSMYFQRAVAIAAAIAAVVVAAHSKHFYTSARTIHLSRSLSHTAKCLHMCFSLLPHYSHRIERLLSVNTLTTNTRTHTQTSLSHEQYWQRLSYADHLQRPIHTRTLQAFHSISMRWIYSHDEINLMERYKRKTLQHFCENRMVFLSTDSCISYLIFCGDRKRFNSRLKPFWLPAKSYMKLKTVNSYGTFPRIKLFLHWMTQQRKNDLK